MKKQLAWLFIREQQIYKINVKNCIELVDLSKYLRNRTLSMGDLKKSFHLIIIYFEQKKKGLRQISPQKPSVCVILSVYVCVSPHHGTQQEDRDSKRERQRQEEKKRIVRREKKNPRLLKCKLIVRVHHKSPMIKVIATNAA